jgi:hypothetical protein
MPVNWDELQKELFPIKSYEDLFGRLQNSCSYAFVRDYFNFSIPELASYTEKLLGGDSRQRYTEYLARLNKIINQLDQACVKDILDLQERTASRQLLESFIQQSGVLAVDITSLLKFLVYWLIPGEKYLSGLVRDDPQVSAAIQLLAAVGIRTNLQLLEKGLSRDGRRSLRETSGLPPGMISALVNRADFSRLPWASKATISNIIGAGYQSISQLASAEPQKLYDDFFNYGKSIGKNLKLGNEIENSYRIAKIVPVLLREE